jgi:hypothetical protein
MHTPCQLQLDVYGQSSSLKCTPPLICKWTCMARAIEMHAPLDCRWKCMARAADTRRHPSNPVGRVWPEQPPETHTPSQLQVDMYGQSN